MGGRGGGSGRGGAAGGGARATTNDKLNSGLTSIDKAKFTSNPYGLSYAQIRGVGLAEIQEVPHGYEVVVYDAQGKIYAASTVGSLGAAKSLAKAEMRKNTVQSAFKSSVGKTVGNNGMALGKAIGADAGSVRHIGNFEFSATVKGVKVRIVTTPTDWTAGKIKINGVYEG